MAKKSTLSIPDFSFMSKYDVEKWLKSLSTQMVYAHFKELNLAIMARFGDDARVTTSTYQPPKIMRMVIDVY